MRNYLLPAQPRETVYKLIKYELISCGLKSSNHAHAEGTCSLKTRTSYNTHLNAGIVSKFIAHVTKLCHHLVGTSI